jgi:hypothetical protein
MAKRQDKAPGATSNSNYTALNQLANSNKVVFGRKKFGSTFEMPANLKNPQARMAQAAAKATRKGVPIKGFK